MMPPTPAPDLPLPKAARVINIITALTGLVSSGLLGFFAIFMGLSYFRLGTPPIYALFVIAVLGWGCSAYRAVFTPCKRLALLTLLFQTFLMGGLLWLSVEDFQNTRSRPDAYAPWMPSTATGFLVFSSLAFLSHLLSLAIRLIYNGNESKSD